MLATPTIRTCLPTLAETDIDHGPPGTETKFLAVSANTRPFNYLGLPAVSVPCGFDPNGLPIGLQIAGRPFAEARMLKVADAYQRDTDFHARRPPVLEPPTPRRHRRMKPKVAFIGTGGTFASIGARTARPAGLRRHRQADARRRNPGAVSGDRAGRRRVPRALSQHPQHGDRFCRLARAGAALRLNWSPSIADLAGIVIGHGTATLEETAYFLNLTLKVPVPVVLVGAQRPPSALSSDAGLNLVNAIRVAASPEARGMGVLVVLNDEVQAAREVTKTSTLRLQTFRTADFGVLGHADGDAVAFYRRPLRRCCPDTEFDIRALDALPRVDIAYAYAGADGTAVRAFIAAGARGHRLGRFRPGFRRPRRFRGDEAGGGARHRGRAVHPRRIGTHVSRQAPRRCRRS